jgi:DNA-binding Lrp family transcriptional regulator
MTIYKKKLYLRGESQKPETFINKVALLSLKMRQNLTKLSENEKKFLISLLNGGNKTDVEIAKKTGINKSTCSRIRKKLEKDLITDYIPIIELDKVGIDVFVVLMFKWKAFDNEELTKKVFTELKEDPHVIFLASGEGSSQFSTVMFLGFTDIEQYHEYFKQFRKKYDKHTDNVSSLLLPSREVIKTDFTQIIKHVVKGGK